MALSFHVHRAFGAVSDEQHASEDFHALGISLPWQQVQYRLPPKHYREVTHDELSVQPALAV
jgi:hypothetical protein